MKGVCPTKTPAAVVSEAISQPNLEWLWKSS